MSSSDSLPQSSVDQNRQPDSTRCLVCQGALLGQKMQLIPTRTAAPGSYELMTCQDCGLEQTQPRLSETEILELQESTQSPAVTPDRYSDLVGRVMTSPLYRLFLTLDGDWAGHLPALNSSDNPTKKGQQPRLLDVGCGQGRSSHLYDKAGYAVTGLEPSPNAAQKARQRGLAVAEETLQAAQLSGPFDALLLANVLEHLEDPPAALARCADLLAPDGWLFLSCPNRLSWQRRLFGAAWINWYVPFHLSHFAPADIERLVARTGLKISRKEQVSPSLWTAQSLVCRLTGNRPRSARWLRRPLVMATLTFLAASLGWPIRALSNRLGRGDCLIYYLRKS